MFVKSAIQTPKKKLFHTQSSLLRSSTFGKLRPVHTSLKNHFHHNLGKNRIQTLGISSLKPLSTSSKPSVAQQNRFNFNKTPALNHQRTHFPVENRRWSSTSTSKKLSFETLKRLPKAELHLHLDGAVRTETIFELAQEQGISLPAKSVPELKKLVSIHEERVDSLETYLKCFEITLSVLQTPYAIKRVMYECCEDQYNQGVRYVEVRFSPLLHQEQGMSLSQVMEAVCEGVALAEYHFHIVPKIIICGMRHLDSKQTEVLAEIAWRYSDKNVVAFDLAGPEKGFSSKKHKSAFDIVRNKLLNCTLHSGEAYGWQSIADSIHYCGLHRIGHGITLETNKDLMNYVIAQRIPIETCLTSNVQTSSIPNIKAHPIRRYFDAGVTVVPCTDNTHVSNTDINQEYSLIQDNFDFSVPEMIELIDSGIKSAFCNRTTRSVLRTEFAKDCFKVLSEAGHDISFFESPAWRLRGLNYPVTKQSSYWMGASSKITLDLIKELPKADLHCRMVGSASFESLRKLIEMEGNEPLDVQLLESLQHTKQQAATASNSLVPHSEVQVFRELFLKYLQTSDQIEQSVEDIVRGAANDKVRYMEMYIRPPAHTRKGLSEKQVVDIVLKKLKQLDASHGVKVNALLYANPALDDPIAFRQVAELCVENKENGVCGFGAIGKPEIGPEAIAFFRSTFEFLKKNNVNVVMKSGATQRENLVSHLNEANAVRISGGFELHRSPKIMSYLANHRIPLEIGFTDLYTASHSFSGNPVRLYLDNHVPIALSSFHASLNAFSRSEQILKVATAINCDIADLVSLLHYPFSFNFNSAQERAEVAKTSAEDAFRIVNKYGIEEVFRRNWIPDEHILEKKD